MHLLALELSLSKSYLLGMDRWQPEINFVSLVLISNTNVLFNFFCKTVRRQCALPFERLTVYCANQVWAVMSPDLKHHLIIKRTKNSRKEPN